MDKNLITVGINKVAQIFTRSGNEPEGINIKRFWNLMMQNFGVGQPHKLLNNWRRHPENSNLTRSVITLIIDKSGQNNIFYSSFENIIRQILTGGEGEKLVRTTSKGKPKIEKGFKKFIIDPLKKSKKFSGRGKDNFDTKELKNLVERDHSSLTDNIDILNWEITKRSIEKPAPVKRVPCNFAVRINNEILHRMPTIVTVIISRKAIGNNRKSIQAKAGADVDKDHPLLVRISAVSQIRIKGERKHTVEVPDGNRENRLTFEVIGLRTGICSLRVDIWQKHSNICSLTLSPNCVKKVRSQKPIRRYAKRVIGTAPAEDLIRLEISERQVGRSTYYDYHLVAEELGIFDEYVSPRITKQERYIQSLYSQIDRLYDESGNSADEIQDSLKEYGAELFSYLFPPKLQADLYNNLSKIKSIQLISTEPYIPWELLLVRDPDQSKGWDPKDKFMGELGLTRWLFGWVAPKKITIRKTKAKYVIPEYTDSRIILPAAVDERKYLVQTFRAKQVNGNAASVRKLLRQKGSFDLLHFCCHGEADSRSILFSRLLLQEKKNTLPTYLNQATISQAGKFGTEKNRPMVVLNACQAGRRGKGLVGYGGFANAFLKGGAGAFIGSLWSIDDETALSFITTFYKALKDGYTLAEATIKARTESAKRKDTTWISYTIYGNPFARFTFS